jgi:acyl carrier protein
VNKQEFFAQLEEFMELDEGRLTGEESLDDLPWDSLAVVSFIAMADEHLELAVKPASITQAKSVADLLALVADKLDN